MLSDEQHFQPGSLLLDQPAGFNTIHSWHSNIEHYDIGLQTADLFQGFNTIRRFAHDFPLGPPFQQSPQPLPDNGMIIHQQNANRHKQFPASDAASCRPFARVQEKSNIKSSAQSKPPAGYQRIPPRSNTANH